MTTTTDPTPEPKQEPPAPPDPWNNRRPAFWMDVDYGRAEPFMTSEDPADEKQEESR